MSMSCLAGGQVQQNIVETPQAAAGSSVRDFLDAWSPSRFAAPVVAEQRVHIVGQVIDKKNMLMSFLAPKGGGFPLSLECTWQTCKMTTVV